MYEIGRLCVKIAGRDARKKCVVIDIIDDKYVLIDGETRRRKCNVKHLEPLDKVLKIKKNASGEEIIQELRKEGINVVKKSVEKSHTKIKKEDMGKERKEEKMEIKESKRDAKKETKENKESKAKKERSSKSVEKSKNK